MSTKFGRQDKPKGKFAQNNINIVYRGNASESHTRPAFRSSGFQLVGKLQGTRRNPPPPPWVPSIKSEMGGQDTKVNIVPPGGSGWGTNATVSSSVKDQPKNEQKSDTLNAIVPENANESSEKSVSDSKNVASSEESLPLIKPPPKPFFATRPLASATTKTSADDNVRSLSTKSSGPSVPFYQRSTTTPANLIPERESEASEPPADDSFTDVQDDSENSTLRTGWAAVTTEEPDFQERINFSDTEEDEISKKSLEDSMDLQKPKVPESWCAASQQQKSSAQISFQRSDWEHPTCYNPLSSVQHVMNTSFVGRNDGIFTGAISAVRGDTFQGQEAALLAEQFQRSFTASEADVQAQREERTLAFKAAVDRAQMARKKRSEVASMENKRSDRSVAEDSKGVVDDHAFSQSMMQPSSITLSGPQSLSMQSGITDSPQQQSLGSPFATMYSTGLPSLMHSMTSSTGLIPSQMKPQSSLANPLSSNSWNPGSFASNNQASFIQPYPISNSPKLSMNQGFYYKSDPFTMNSAFSQQIGSKGSSHTGLQSDHSADNVGRNYTPQTIGDSVLSQLPFQSGNPRVVQQQQPSCTSPVVIEKRLESETSSNMKVSLSRTGLVGNQSSLQVTAHADGTRTAFTPPVPSSVEGFSSTQNTSNLPAQQSQTPSQSQSQITPLMDLTLSGKWSEKDFDAFSQSVASRGSYVKSYKSFRGSASKHQIDGSHRHGAFPSGGRQQNRGSAARDSAKRSNRQAVEAEENRTDGSKPSVESESRDLEVNSQLTAGVRRNQHREETSDSVNTFPRQQRSKGANRLARSNPGGPVTTHGESVASASKQTTVDSDRRDKWKSTGISHKSGSKQGGADSVVEKASSVTSGGSGRGRKNFTQGCRRLYAGTGVVDQRQSSEDVNGVCTVPNMSTSFLRTSDIACGDSLKGAVNHDDTTVQGALEPGANASSQPVKGQQHQYSQRLHQSGNTKGGRRGGGQHGGAQRRDRTDRNVTAMRRQNRRHPDEDDDQGFRGGVSSTGISTSTSATPVVATATKNDGEASTESTGTANNGSGGGSQQDGVVDSLPVGGNNVSASAGGTSSKSRSHAHSVTLTSDVEVWETASEGFSSLLGTSPGCSFAECINAPLQTPQQMSPTPPIQPPDSASTTLFLSSPKDYVSKDGVEQLKDPTDDGVEKGEEEQEEDNGGGYGDEEQGDEEGKKSGHQIRRPVFHRPTPKITGKIVPLMSINAEAPPSYNDDPSFLDSPPLPTKSSGNKEMHPTELPPGVMDNDSLGSEESTSAASEDGFMEVRSKSSKRQQKTKKQSKNHKSSDSPDSRTSVDKLKSRETVKQRVHASKTDNVKLPKTFKSDEASVKEKQRCGTSSTTSVTTSSQVGDSSVAVGKRVVSAPAPVPTNAWLKPLQETINEKAVAAAKVKKGEVEDASVQPSKTATETASSSYAWSVVVGSRATAPLSAICDAVESDSSATPTKQCEKADNTKLTQISDHTTISSMAPGSVQSVLKATSSSPLRQSNLAEKEDAGSLSGSSKDPVAIDTSSIGAPVSTMSVTPTTANVCKVRPQAVVPASSSPVATAVHNSKSEAGPPYTGGSMTLNASTAPASQYRRPPPNCDSGDWFGKTSGMYSSCSSSSMLFDGFGNRKGESTTTDPNVMAAAATLYLQQQHHQQQQNSFRQTLSSFQHHPQQQPMMGFGLPDLSMRSSSNRMGSQCSQSILGSENFFTVSPFGLGNTVQGGTQQVPPQQRGIYPPAPSTQPRGFHPWQQQHPSQPDNSLLAAAAVGPQSALWSSSYTPPTHTQAPHQQHPSYVGVIGAERPSAANAAASLAPPRLGASSSSSMYGSSNLRAAAAATAGGNGPHMQAAPSGLYAPSPTHPTPPPHSFDPSFAYTSSANLFSHHPHHQSAGSPALMAAAAAAAVAAQRQPTGAARTLGGGIDNGQGQAPIFTPFPAAPPPAIPMNGLTGPPF